MFLIERKRKLNLPKIIDSLCIFFQFLNIIEIKFVEFVNPWRKRINLDIQVAFIFQSF